MKVSQASAYALHALMYMVRHVTQLPATGKAIAIPHEEEVLGSGPLYFSADGNQLTADDLGVTEQALARGIAAAQVGKRLGDIGAAVQRYVEAEGFSVVRDFVGHGIGRALHEAPQVPNFGAPGTGLRLRPGMVLAIEPMVNAGSPEVDLLGDGWTAVTADGSLSAHFEHTVAITEAGPVVLGTERSVGPH